MRKKQMKTIALAAGRGILLAAFCLAFTVVILPGGGDTLPVDAQAVLSSEALSAAPSELPEIGEKLIPLGKTTGIKLFSKGTMVVGFSDLESCGHSPAKTGGLQVGDVLLQLNGKEIQGNEGMTSMLSALENGSLEEAWGCGTAAVVSPIGKLALGEKEYVIGGGKIGEVTGKLYDILTGIQWGKVEDTFHWVYKLS